MNASFVRRPRYGPKGEAEAAHSTAMPEYIATQGPLPLDGQDLACYDKWNHPLQKYDYLSKHEKLKVNKVHS